MLEAFVSCLLVEQAKGNSKSVEVSATPAGKNNRWESSDAEDRSNGGLAPPASHRFVMGYTDSRRRN
ncbi:hypothetical protein Halar_0749 [halophilic archaeon DL31]|nr:hypothetical protein Halar_0749 [halophilic archaeon DL31]